MNTWSLYARVVFTQPLSVTVCPTWLSRSSPQVQVRRQSVMARVLCAMVSIAVVRDYSDTAARKRRPCQDTRRRGGIAPARRRPDREGGRPPPPAPLHAWSQAIPEG